MPIRWGWTLIVTLFLGTAQGQETGGWKAGAARVKITPDQPMWMSGYAARTRPAEGKLHDLWAKALAVEDSSGRRGLMVTLDLCGIGRDLSVEICQALMAQHQLPREAVILSVSHTHSGPVVKGNLDTMYFLDAAHQKLVDQYAERLRKSILDVASTAFGQLAPARILWENGLATFAVNRRNNREAEVPASRTAGTLRGPVDHEVPVLAVRHPVTGALRAIVFGYACHATVLDGLQWSGDYPGEAQLALEQSYPDALALFWAGCGADQNPVPRRQAVLSVEYGRQLADRVSDVLRRPMTPVTGGLRMAYAEIDLAFADLPSRDQLVKEAASSDPKQRYVASRARMLLQQLEQKGSLRGTYPYPVQVWQWGPDLRLVTLGGEVVVDYSLRLKSELGKGRTWVMGYANDVMAYIPSLRVLKEGGYEGGGAMVYYGLPTVWSPQVEERIVKAVHDLASKGK